MVTLSHLRENNGITKRLGKRTPRDSDSGSFNTRYACLLAVLWIGGCTTLKKAMIVGGGSLGAGAIASIATSGTAPVLLASVAGASVTSVVAELMSPSKGDSMPIAASCAPDNFWTLLGDLVSMGGWFLILVVIVPMVLGWLLPGPLERKKRK